LLQCMSQFLARLGSADPRPGGSARRTGTALSPLGPTPPTCAVQQVGSYLGYGGRGANAFGKAAPDPEPPSPNGCYALRAL